MTKAIITLKQEVDKYYCSTEAIESNYINFAQKHKLKPVLYSSLYNYSDEEILENDIFILTGSGMISQKYILFNENTFEQAQRDIFENKLIDLAVKHNKLLIGICRGMQLINCYFGGKISKYFYSDRQVRIDHEITLLGKPTQVNNFHNYCVYNNDLGSSLNAIGIDEKYNITEAFINTNGNILGLQWHPERDFEKKISMQNTDELISKFLNCKELTL